MVVCDSALSSHKDAQIGGNSRWILPPESSEDGLLQTDIHHYFIHHKSITGADRVSTPVPPKASSIITSAILSTRSYCILSSTPKMSAALFKCCTPLYLCSETKEQQDQHLVKIWMRFLTVLNDNLNIKNTERTGAVIVP